MQQNVILRNKSREGADVGNTDLEGNSLGLEGKNTWKSPLSDQRLHFCPKTVKFIIKYVKKKSDLSFNRREFSTIHGFHVLELRIKMNVYDSRSF